MLAKRFRLPIQGWIKNKKRKTITKKGNFFIVKIRPNNLSFSRFGIIISLKTAKKANERNRLKRTIFNFIRSAELFEAAGSDILIIAGPSISRFKKPEIEKELKKLLTHG